MTYRELGGTGLKLSVVSYGAASIGNEYGNLDEAQGIHAPPLLRHHCRKAVDYCDRKGVDIASLAIRFCVENSEITTTVAGTANPVNMANILNWIEQPLDHELLKVVQEILEPVKNVLWPVGRPENSERYEEGL